MNQNQQYQEEEPETFPINPCAADLALLDILASRRYDNLNHVIKDGVCKTYKAEMLPLCDELLENEKILGRVEPIDELKETYDENEDEETWFKDPTQLNSFELFQAISGLTMRIEKQRKINDRSQGDIEILSLAKSSLDLELGFKLVELISEEQKFET